MRRSNSTASNTSRTTTIRRTNPDRSMSLTRRTVSQYGSFEIVKEDTKFIPAPPPRRQQPSPRLMLSPSSHHRGPPSILSDSDLATVSEEEPLQSKVGESETTRHNPPPRTLSPIKPALKDSSSVASSDNESISGAKLKKPHARVSFFEDDELAPGSGSSFHHPHDPFRHFGAASPPAPSQHNYTTTNRKTKTATPSSPHLQPFNTMNAKTHAAQAAFKPKAPAAASASRSPNLAAAAAARSHNSVNRKNTNESDDDDDDDDDSGESIYSDCDDGLEANGNNNNNNNSIMEALQQAPPVSKKKTHQQQQPATLRANKKPQEARPSNTSHNVARKPVPAAAGLHEGEREKKAVKPVALDITPRPSDADDDDSDDSDTWRRQRMARRRNGANGHGRMRMSLRDENKARPSNNPAIPTPPPSDTSTAAAQPHIPASVMATAAQNVALTTKAMNGGPATLARTPSESSFKKERAAANGGDSSLQNGFRLSLRNEADKSSQQHNNAAGGRFKSRFDDTDSEDDDDFAAPPLAAKSDYLSAPAFREKDNHQKEHSNKKLSVFSPKKEAKVLIPRKKPSKSQLNGDGGGGGGAELAPISSASAADSPTEPAAPKATKSVPTMRAPKPAATTATTDNYYPAAPIHHKRFKGLRRLFKLD